MPTILDRLGGHELGDSGLYRRCQLVSPSRRFRSCSSAERSVVDWPDCIRKTVRLWEDGREEEGRKVLKRDEV